MSSRSPHTRMRSSTRMDVVQSLLSSKPSNKQYQLSPAYEEPDSPRDSLSPLGEEYKGIRHARSAVDLYREHEKIPPRISVEFRNPFAAESTTPAAAPARTRSAQTLRKGKLHAGFPSLPSSQAQQNNHCQQAPAVTKHPQSAACRPRFLARSHYPSPLDLDKTNGYTTKLPRNLRPCIRDAVVPTARDTVSSQQPATLRSRPAPTQRRTYRKGPVPPPPIVADTMGNESSKQLPDGTLAADNESMRSVVRKPLHARLPRKSSMNIFKRMDSKNPLSPSATATVITVPPPDDMTLDGAPRNVPMPPMHPRRSLQSPSNEIEAQPRPSTATMTERLAQQPLSASNTITNIPAVSKCHRSNPSSSNDADNEASSDKVDSRPPSVPLHRSSALSPTLPTPSPLPEDSPHKYGLRDRMDTPEMPEPVQSIPDVNVVKARRRSSGLEIFNVRFPVPPTFLPNLPLPKRTPLATKSTKSPRRSITRRRRGPSLSTLLPMFCR